MACMSSFLGLKIRKVPWKISVIAVFVQLCCRAEYTLTLTPHSYSNVGQVKMTNICCDDLSWPPCTDACDNLFTFCVLHTGRPLPVIEYIQRTDCPLGFFTFPTLSNDDITSNRSDPLVSTGDVWPVRYKI